MKLADYRADYYAFSAKASEISRQLSFAGIALIWILRPKSTELVIPKELLVPAAFFVVALALDLLQAIYSTFVWGVFSWYHEWRDRNAALELNAPSWFNWTALLFFWGKVFAVIFAYVMTLRYVWVLFGKF